MYYPSKKEFLKLSASGNLIPVYKEISADFETVLSAFRKICAGDYAFLLESVEGGERLGRYSFLGSDPSLIFQSKGRLVTIKTTNSKRSFETDDPINELRKIMRNFISVKVKGLPRFFGGLVGYMGYDVVRFMEDLPDKNSDSMNLPDTLFMLTDTLIIFDHVDHKIKVVSNAHINGSPSKAYSEALKKIDSIVARLNRAVKMPCKRVRGKGASAVVARVTSNMSRKEFMNSVVKAKEYIKKGDIIQVVLSQRFETSVTAEPFQIYRSLRSINPSPYMYYLKLGSFSLVGSSPEIMVRCDERKVEVRPIAGTRRRGSSQAEDEMLIKELLSDPKEKAEHIMLVDLGRNDIGRVCDFKTISVSDLMSVEKYSHVMHIVTDVSGLLSEGRDVFDVVKAAFPAGTVTGAPKVRAMEIIDTLENTRRGTYAGSVGYFSFSGNLDTCITIRTILIKDGTAYIQAGAGIVADSDPRKEYEETVNKARALIKAIEMANGEE